MVIINKGFLEDVRGTCEKEGARKDREAEDIAFLGCLIQVLMLHKAI